MIDSHLRAPLQSAFIDPVVRRLGGRRWNPLHVTGAALALGLGAGAALALRRPWWAAAALLGSGYLDALDGSLARAAGRVSDRGAALDIISDRAVEFAAILGLFLERPAGRALPCLLMLGSAFLCVTTFLVVGIFEQNRSHKSFHYSPGIMERAEAFLLFEAMILLPAAFLPLSGLFTGLVLLTAAIRTWEFSRR